MNGKQAKRLRKIIYQNLALKSLEVIEYRKRANTIFNIGLRAKYQEFKKKFKSFPWNLKSDILKSWE